MRILFTNNTLESPAGSELVVVELAEALRARGHEVAAYSTHLGEMGERLRGHSIPVLRDPQASPFEPEVIHGQHHLDAMAALCAFPNVPALYHCHGYVPWVERPPKHPRIHHYVGMCELISERIRIELGLNDEHVVTVPNWFDATRFRAIRRPNLQPLRALLFQRGFDRQGWHADQLQRGFERAGIMLDLDLPSGDRRRPEVILPDYDIVLASGRSAIEAMACGCAVMPLSATSCLDFVTRDNFDLMRAQNFSPRLQTGQLCLGSITERLALYNAEATAAVTDLVRNECTLEMAATQLEALYRITIEKHRDQAMQPTCQLKQELAALSQYLQMVKPMVRELDMIKQAHNQCIEGDQLHRSLMAENSNFKKEALLLRQECLELRNSTSWRITGALRGLGRLWRKRAIR